MDTVGAAGIIVIIAVTVAIPTGTVNLMRTVNDPEIDATIQIQTANDGTGVITIIATNGDIRVPIVQPGDGNRVIERCPDQAKAIRSLFRRIILEDGVKLHRQ